MEKFKDISLAERSRRAPLQANILFAMLPDGYLSVSEIIRRLQKDLSGVIVSKRDVIQDLFRMASRGTITRPHRDRYSLGKTKIRP